MNYKTKSNGSPLTRSATLFLLLFVVLFSTQFPFKTTEDTVLSNDLYAFSSADSDTVLNYFPLNAGDWWRYEYTYMNYPPELGRKLFVFDSLLIGGKIYFGIGSDSLHSQKYRIDSLGNVFRLYSNGESVIYPFGSFENDSFMTVDSVYGDTTLITVEEKNVACSAEAGPFQNCISIFIDVLGSYDEEQWITFAPNVGIVLVGQFMFTVSLHSAKIGTTYYGNIVSIEGDAVSHLRSYSLMQNHPNPFNPITTIEYSLPLSGDVSLIIYNLLGEEVARLVDGFQQAGKYTTIWNASHVCSGIYFYRLQAGNFVQARKMMLLK